MNRPTRATEAGQAYLDLQNHARAERRGTQELLTLYVVERWLARLSKSPYAGVRLTMDCMIATARVKFRLDANFGDPVTPAPVSVTIPSLRPGMRAVRVLGYPIETVLAEKIATAIALGPANTRVRDYADISTLTGYHTLAHRTARQALLATSRFRGTQIAPLSSIVGNIADALSTDGAPGLAWHPYTRQWATNSSIQLRTAGDR